MVFFGFSRSGDPQLRGDAIGDIDEAAGTIQLDGCGAGEF
jgi:hypothetical protein